MKFNTQSAILMAVVFSLFSVSFVPVAYAKTLRISAPKVELELSPGETYSGEISLENPDPDETIISMYIEDWVYSAGGTGEKKFSPASTTPLSASKWINFTEPGAPLKPYGKALARYTVTVPQDAKGGYYSVLFFETKLGPSNSQGEEGMSVQVAGRIGSLFFIHIKGSIDRAGDIQKVTIQPPLGNQPMEIETTFQNTGNVDITVAGNFLVMSSEGKVLGRGDLTPIYTFPGVTETRKTEWVGKLPKGSHQLVLTYNLGLGKSIVKEESLTIV